MSERRQQDLGPEDGAERRESERRHQVPQEALDLIERMVGEVEKERAAKEKLAQEVERLRSKDEENYKNSYIDEDTGIANRKALYDTLTELVDIAHNNEVPLALGIGDLDGLKWVNDNVSRKKGDDLIKAGANGFKYAARDTDLVGRWGSDEYFALLPGFKPKPDSSMDDLTKDTRDRFIASVNEEIKKIGLPDEAYAGISLDVIVLKPGESAKDFINRGIIAYQKLKDDRYRRLFAMGVDRRSNDRRLQRPPQETAA